MKKILLWSVAALVLITGFWLINQALFDGVIPEQISQNGFQGNYYKQGDEVNKTAVIIVGGGAYGDFWGAEFAKAGHIGLSLPYHRLEGLPNLIEEIPLEYFEKSIDWLISQPEVNVDKILVMGASTNAELVLLLAATYSDKISGVIAICPSSVTWSNTVFPWSSEEIMSKWTLDGRPVPFVAMEKINGNETNQLETLSYWNAGLDDSLKVSKAAIQVERIGGPILLITPVDDKVWPSFRMSEMIMNRLDDHDFKFNYENITYENAGHTISAQYSKSYTAEKGTMMVDGKEYEYAFGGTPSGTLAAQIDSRKRIMDFVNEF